MSRRQTRANKLRPNKPQPQGAKQMWVLGIDVSQKELVVRFQNESQEFREGKFINQSKGFKKLKKWLKPVNLADIRVCMEATNVYWEEIAEYLHQEGLQVSVVNPMRIKGFAQSQLKRNKTDKVDAQVIAQFCQVNPDLALWTPPNPQQKKLRALVRHREALVKSRTQQSNRLKTVRQAEVALSLKAVIAVLDEQIEQASDQIKELIDQDPDLKQDCDLLRSIKGIGQKTAELILAEMYDLAHYKNARAAAADAGLTPAHHESGSSVRRRPRLSKIGKTAVRGSLFFPALSAIRHNPIVRDLADRLEKRGKHRMVVIGAAMRKLLHLAFGVLKNRTPFDPDFISL